jgi:hypothetical protein
MYSGATVLFNSKTTGRFFFSTPELVLKVFMIVAKIMELQ